MLVDCGRLSRHDLFRSWPCSWAPYLSVSVSVCLCLCAVFLLERLSQKLPTIRRYTRAPGVLLRGLLLFVASAFIQ